MFCLPAGYHFVCSIFDKLYLPFLFYVMRLAFGQLELCPRTPLRSSVSEPLAPLTVSLWTSASRVLGAISSALGKFTKQPLWPQIRFGLQSRRLRAIRFDHGKFAKSIVCCALGNASAWVAWTWIAGRKTFGLLMESL